MGIDVHLNVFNLDTRRNCVKHNEIALGTQGTGEWVVPKAFLSLALGWNRSQAFQTQITDVSSAS
jgi:hypothetical protein